MFKSKRKGKKNDEAEQGSDKQAPPTPPTRTREEVDGAAALLTPPPTASKRASSTIPVPSSAPPRLSKQRLDHEYDEEEEGVAPPASLHRRLFRLRIGSAFKRLAPPTMTPTSTPIKGRKAGGRTEQDKAGYASGNAAQEGG
eukprot:evm.model.NODE_5207_length_48865_cov_35.227627.3